MAIDPVILKSQIDAEIINEILDFGISPANVGNKIKDAIDYTTEQIANVNSLVKVVKTTISNAELLNIFTNPKILIPGVTGKIIQPLNIIFKYNHVLNAYSGGNWMLSINNNLFTVVSNINVPYSTIQSQLVIVTYNDEPANIIGNSLKLTMNANPTLGNGTVDVYVSYIEITS